MNSKFKTVVELEERNGRTVSRRKEYYLSGKLYRDGVYTRGQKDWSWECPIGTVRTYHENGNLKSEEHFDEYGAREGETSIFDAKGKLIKKISYSQDKITKEVSFEEKEGQPMKIKKPTPADS